MRRSPLLGQPLLNTPRSAFPPFSRLPFLSRERSSHLKLSGVMKLLGLGNAEKPQGYENLKENDELESVRIAAAAKTRFIEGEILRMECMEPEKSLEEWKKHSMYYFSRVVFYSGMLLASYGLFLAAMAFFHSRSNGVVPNYQANDDCQHGLRYKNKTYICMTRSDVMELRKDIARLKEFINPEYLFSADDDPIEEKSVEKKDAKESEPRPNVNNTKPRNGTIEDRLQFRVIGKDANGTDIVTCTPYIYKTRIIYCENNQIIITNAPGYVPPPVTPEPPVVRHKYFVTHLDDGSIHIDRIPYGAINATAFTVIRIIKEPPVAATMKAVQPIVKQIQQVAEKIPDLESNPNELPKEALDEWKQIVSQKRAEASRGSPSL